MAAISVYSRQEYILGIKDYYTAMLAIIISLRRQFYSINDLLLKMNKIHLKC